MPVDESAPTEGRLLIADVATTAVQFTILVVARSGVFTYVCPSGGTVSIGRGADVDIRIDDVKASRRHAIVHVLEEAGRCEVEDAGSLNGTRLQDRLLVANQRVPFDLGEPLTIGGTTLTLQRGSSDAPPQRIRDAEAFRARVDAEHARASRGRSSFGLLSIELDARFRVSSVMSAIEAARLVRLDRAFDDCLRASDLVGPTGLDRYGVLLPTTAPDVVEGLAAHLRRELTERGFVHTMHVSCFPRDGQTVEVLSALASPMRDSEEPPKSVNSEGSFERRMAPMIEKIAKGEINVLILGETGVGKEVMSRAIHDRSLRAHKSLVCLNCAALSESLLESELFGHEKGAFTGAIAAKAGLLESAEGGSVFLDEVGEMPLSLQAKLLRVLEQREVLRVGSLRPRPIDVRFIAATNRDLEAEIAAGRFRQDLYFRLNGIALTIPPLRERLDELEPLARAFIEQACTRAKRPTRPRLSTMAMQAMRLYRWPGNIRELRNVIERAVLLCTRDVIAPDVLPSALLAASSPVIAPKPMMPRAPSTSVTLPRGMQRVVVDSESTYPESMERLETGPYRPVDERTQIIAALAACNGNQTHAAKMLGISRRTLITRIEEYDLPRPRKKGDDGDE